MNDDRMTAQQRSVVFAFAAQRVGAEALTKAFGVNSVADLRRIGQTCLKTAIDDRDDAAMEAAMVLCAPFGHEHFEMLCGLLYDDWHKVHEDIVFELDSLRDPRAIDHFARVATKVLEYSVDGGAALRSKAIWGIGNLPGERARRALELLGESDDPFVRIEAAKQLDRRKSPGST